MKSILTIYLKIFIIFLFSTVPVVSDEIKIVSDEIKIPEEKSVIQFDTKLGAVTFAHKKHADLSITECSTCHHKLTPTDTTIKACHSCHMHKKTEVIKARLAFHSRCTGCHEYTTASGQYAGPLKRKCKLCHIKNKKK